jgi:hypothetical protein
MPYKSDLLPLLINTWALAQVWGEVRSPLWGSTGSLAVLRMSVLWTCLREPETQSPQRTFGIP